MTRPLTRLLVTTACVALTAASLPACNGDDDGASQSTPTEPATRQAPTETSDGAATLEGTLTLDGLPLDADFLGVHVVRDGLVAACQNTIPSVTSGRYEVEVASDVDVRGCGAPGAEVLLWTFVNDGYFFTTTTTPWPGDSATATFDAAFTSGAPQGAQRPVTEFKGHLFGRDGSELPAGTVIEAYAGDVRCGVTSLRPREQTEGFYTLIVAGPESLPACAAGASLSFRLDGAPAGETAVNDLRTGSEGHELDLTLR